MNLANYLVESSRTITPSFFSTKSDKMCASPSAIATTLRDILLAMLPVETLFGHQLNSNETWPKTYHQQSQIINLQEYFHSNGTEAIHPTAIGYNGGGISVGRDCIIGENVKIDSNWRVFNRSGQKLRGGGDVTIGHNVTIPPNIIVPPGTHLPDNTKIRNQQHLRRFRAIHTLSSGNPPPPPDTLRSFQPIFILGTGRSGTEALAHSVDNIVGVGGRHEAIRFLASISYIKHLTGQSVKDELIKRWRLFYSTEKILIESDQRFFNLLPELTEIFPKAKFIHIIRNCQDFTKSAKAKSWFPRNIVNSDRMRYYFPSMKNENIWTTMDQVERILWYWNYVNDTIQTDLIQVPTERKLTIWLEAPDIEEQIREFTEISALSIVKRNSSNQLGLNKKPLSAKAQQESRIIEAEFRNKFNV